MLIPHPLLGPRDASEFVYLGDASLLQRPDGLSAQAAEAFHDYLHLRDNPAGEHRELWYHEQGDRSWLVVTRNTLTHDISRVEIARDVALALRTVAGQDAGADAGADTGADTGGNTGGNTGTEPGGDAS